MLSLVSKTISIVWNQLGRLGNNGDEQFDNSVQSVDSDLDSDTEENTVSEEIHGIVTKVNPSEKFGLINEDIYFNFDTVINTKQVCVGNNVIATVCRSRKGDPWKATRILAVETYWNDAGNSKLVENTNDPHPQSNIGVVVSICNDVLTLKDGSEILLQDTVCDEFKPQIGDVIQFFSETKILQPARTREVTGQVTRINPDGCGTINQEVWFDSTVCMNNFRPRRGSNVVASAIESHQEVFMWRATNVVPKELPHRPLSNNLWQKNRSPVQKNFLQNLLSDKCNITITSPLDFGVMMHGTSGYITVYINNNGQEDKILSQCRLQRKESVFALGTIEGVESSSVEFCENIFNLPPRAKAYLNVFCNALQLGKHRELVVFHFEDFEIGRYVTVQVDHPLQNSIPNGAHYKNRDFYRNSKPEPQRQNEWILPGEKPFRTRHYLPVSLPMFNIPEKLKLTILEKGDVVSVAPSLAQTLSLECYADRFSTLLFMEEIHMQLDMRQFDMHDVCLSPLGSECLSLSVPGLAEGRPSLLIGDRVYLRSPDGSPGPVFQGFIHEVLRNEVLIKFHSSFHEKYYGESYDVQFEFSRTGMRRCHQAVKLAKALVHPDVLFPIVMKVEPPNFQKGKIEFVNTQLNARQKSAVKRVLENQCRPLPYIIFGPPGTGKTVTLVEASLQVFKNISSSRLIICAPTNSAADLITLRLHQSGLISSNDLARLNAFQRNQDSIPECIQKYCFYGDEELDKLIYYRIIVSTLGNIGIVYGLKLGSGHFTHLFLDEAGQATEPESLVAMELVTSAGLQGQVVLAGDPKQLGPVLTSPYSKFYGLQLSFLERLMSRQLYSRDEVRFADHGNYDPLLVTKLVENYRSHQSLLSLYSGLFYESELVPSAKNLTPIPWKRLNNIDFPFLFHGIKGEQVQDPDSPSWFNPAEVVQTVTYLQELYDLKLTPEDVGIITPYRKQVEKIRLLCETLGLDMCKIGSVEEFQGQEKRIILLSVVRSTKSEHSDFHYSYLGFLGQPKRFNVSISRAQSLLVVLGDPDLLMCDEHWKSLVKYSIDNNAYIGCPIQES